MNYPSKKAIAKHLNIDSEKAAEVRAILDGTAPFNEYKSVQDWERQCFNPLHKSEKQMCALNEVLVGYGTEVIRGRYVSNFYQDCQAEYINMGDTYTTTILRDNESGRFILTSWGDWVGRNERTRKLI